MKRFLVILLTAVLTFSLLPSVVFAENESGQEIVSETNIDAVAETVNLNESDAEPAEADSEINASKPEDEDPALAGKKEEDPGTSAAEELPPIENSEGSDAAEETVPPENGAEPDDAEGTAPAAEPVLQSEMEEVKAAEDAAASDPAETVEAENTEAEMIPAEEVPVISAEEEQAEIEKAYAKIDLSTEGSVTIKYASLVYTGKARTQSTTTVVTAKGKTLTRNTDYKITYKNNVNVGTATMTITGIGNYKGTLKKNFTITPASITSATIKYASLVYTGKARTQSGTSVCMAKDKKLTRGTDYLITYKNNVNVGTATMTFKGIGNYKGTIKKTFKITPRPLSRAELAFPKQHGVKTYTGKAIQVSVYVYGVVKGKETKLTKGTDYTLSYQNNIDPGVAMVIAKGTGNFKGTVKCYFTISPGSIVLKKVVNDELLEHGATAYNVNVTASDGAFWNYSSPNVLSQNSYPKNSIGEIGVYNGLYYLYEGGKVFALEVDSGSVSWVSDDFSASKLQLVSSGFDKYGNLYCACRNSGLIFCLDPKGNTVNVLQLSPDSNGSYPGYDNIQNLTVNNTDRYLTVRADPYYEEISSSDEYHIVKIDLDTLQIIGYEVKYSN